MKGFANETACINRVLLCHVCINLKLSIEQNHIKVSLYYRKNRFVMYVFFDMLNKYFIAQIAERTFILYW